MTAGDRTGTFRQLPLDLGWRAAMDAEDFLVAAPNRDAVNWIDRWPYWPAPALAIWGATGSGKTHLMRVWLRKSSGAPVVGPLSGRALSDDPVLAGPAGPWVVDDADRMLSVHGRVGQQWLLHLLNRARDDGGTVLLTGRTAPAAWSIDLPDLASRVRSLPTARIDDPDDQLVGALLMKLFADRQIRPSAEVLTYAVRRLPRDFAIVRRFVVEADRHSLAGKRPVTVPLIRSILETLPDGAAGASGRTQRFGCDELP
ncbi:DNA replication protein [Fodinicurvata sp. EGI_FJ10296]|uniref:HdaA/DnaA family protein n=1 Tax=Fodinicurvata sp. EGI_FJ10296 TaxID=3231908 RepID=UPI003451B021